MPGFSRCKRRATVERMRARWLFFAALSVSLGATITAALAQDGGVARALAPQSTSNVPAHRVVQLGLGAEFSFARTSGGALRMWGRNNSGVARDGAFQHDVPAAIEVGRSVASVHVGYAHACALGADQQLFCWGNNRDGQLGHEFDPSVSFGAAPAVVRLSSGSITSVSLGSAHTCASVEARGVLCWGLDREGQCTGTPSDHARPTLVANTAEVTQVAAGAQFSCGRTRRGTVLCWGDNEAGQLGRAPGGRDSAPRAIDGLSDVRSIAAGYSHACAIGNDASLRCWGLDAWGAMGTTDPSSPRDHWRPTLINGVRAVREIALGYGFTCALSDEPDRARVRCWGHAQYGKTGVEWHDRRDPTPHEIALSAEPESIAASGDHACAVLRGGAVECWGDGSHGELGDGRALFSAQLTAVPSLQGITSIVAGPYATCASTQSAMWCWGGAVRGQFSTESSWGSATPVRFRSGTHGGAISLGASAACECPRSGSCSCAGEGLLHDATGRVVGSVGAPHYAFARGLGRFRVRSAAATQSIHCMALDDGRVICVGEDRDHLISGVSTGARAVARLMDTGLRGPQRLFAAPKRVCSLDARGTLRCFGENTDRSIDDGEASVRSWTTVIAGVRAAARARSRGPLVALSRTRTCVIVNGAVRCRGGAGARDGFSAITELPDAEAIYSGTDSFCARRTNGQYFCWGLNAAFRSALAGSYSSAPTEVPSLRGALELAIGQDHLCARWSNGTVSCVGSDANSQLGLGRASWTAQPVRVRFSDALNGSTAGP